MSVAASGSLREELPESLETLQTELESKYHVLAKDGDEDLAKAALQVVKDVFDMALEYEQLSHPHIQPFIVSTLEPPTISTRSTAKANGKHKANGTGEVEEDEAIDPDSVLPYTPLSGLTTEAMDIEQIWAQLELRNEGLVQVLKHVGPLEMDDEDSLGGSESSDEDDDDDEEDEDDLEDMTEEEFREMMLRGDLGDSDEDDGSDEEDGSGDDQVDFYDDGVEGDSDEEEDDEEEQDEADEDMNDEDLELGSESDDGLDLEGSEGLESNEDEEQDDDDDDGEDEDEEDLDEEGEDEPDDRALLFDEDEAGPSRPRTKKRHPTLDDDFFSIDDFNRQTEEAEAGQLSSGRLGGDEDEDEEELDEDIGGLMINGASDGNKDLMYSDFFAPPRGAARAKGQPSAKDKDRKVGKKGKGKQIVRFDEVEASENEDAEDEEEGREVMGRFKGDLFDDEDEEEETDGKDLSTHERQQLALAKQIAQLEQEAVGPKDWTLLGEATSRARPENSLLEEDLDFEQVAKVTPVVTEDTVKTLEELIKKRIIDNNFDSPVRVRAYEPTPFLPSRYFELQDTQSSKSLAQIYEDEYQAAAAGGKARDPRDEKLRVEHEAIDKLWEDICYKLDALSSLNFVPKQPKASITTLDNLPTTSLESALPPTSAVTTLLAPEELFAAPPTATNIARSEQTPEQAHAARNRRRKAQKGERKRLEEMAELYGKKPASGKSGIRAEKQKALEGLVKTGKGVTVVGKGSKNAAGDRGQKRGREEQKDRAEDGKRLKL
ncbi:Mpp10 protein-domain-containing protein [Kockovaella imperatae]|uniref:U3 small nucleolar ribonucleoprotein protein MPP10 n=1 Tax=Kockovaella imperatae TaxID=4999 RepID=A0A1Y1U760_9TREE|nr:Mpp10 protein-domain-containing protein [Kockovaella imperatae]ORX33861.1 Mpp10 protein-domain-containing protein [Kockovaella imperatae]